jgi:hypothetical protein
MNTFSLFSKKQQAAKGWMKQSPKERTALRLVEVEDPETWRTLLVGQDEVPDNVPCKVIAKSAAMSLITVFVTEPEGSYKMNILVPTQNVQ